MDLLLLVAGLLSLSASPDVFTVGTARAERGRNATGFIEVPAGVDAGTSIPVEVVHGARPGPVLAIVSGRFSGQVRTLALPMTRAGLIGLSTRDLPFSSAARYSPS